PHRSAAGRAEPRPGRRLAQRPARSARCAHREATHRRRGPSPGRTSLRRDRRDSPLQPGGSTPRRRGRSGRPSPRLSGVIMSLTDAFSSSDDGARLADLHARLAQRAEQEEVLDVAYRTVASPVGELLLAATPRGLVRIAYQVQGFEQVLTDLATSVSPRILRAP